MSGAVIAASFWCAVLAFVLSAVEQERGWAPFAVLSGVVAVALLAAGSLLMVMGA